MAWLPKSRIPKFALVNLKEELVVRLKPGPYDDEATFVRMWEERDGYLGLPRAYYNRTSAGKLPVEYNVCRERREFQTELGPRDDQQHDGIATIHNRLDVEDVTETILQAATGVGKTVMSLLIAAKLGYTTMVLVHTSVLYEQWKDRILRDPAVLPHAKVGGFQADTEEFGEDYDIVIGMVQTLANRPEDHPIFEWPGLLIVDEAHRMAAPTFNDVIHRFNAAKRLGLTATPRRKDGGERLFFDALGQIGWVGEGTPMRLHVRRLLTPFHHTKKRLPRYVEIGWMVRNKERNQIIVNEVDTALNHERNPIVLTERIEHVLLLKQMLEERNPEITYGMCVGEYYVDEDDARIYVEDRKGYQRLFEGEDGEIDLNKVDNDRHNFGWIDNENLQTYAVEVEDEDGEVEVEEIDPRREIRSFVKDPEGYQAQFHDEDGEFLPETIVEGLHRVIDTEAVIGQYDWVTTAMVQPTTQPIRSIVPRRYKITPEMFREEQDKDLLFATYGKVREGFDVPRLDTAYFATPTPDPEQAAGRILRTHPDKKKPIAVYFIDYKLGKYKGIWGAAYRVFRDMDAEVKQIDI
jgi:superfamily II DNA or RNA helicase